MTGYLAQIKRNGSDDMWHNCSLPDTPHTTSCSFTNLKKDTSYEVRVMAKNKAGFGLPSHKVIKTKKTGNNTRSSLKRKWPLRDSVDVL